MLATIVRFRDYGNAKNTTSGSSYPKDIGFTLDNIYIYARIYVDVVAIIFCLCVANLHFVLYIIWNKEGKKTLNVLLYGF